LGVQPVIANNLILIEGHIDLRQITLMMIYGTVPEKIIKFRFATVKSRPIHG